MPWDTPLGVRPCVRPYSGELARLPINDVGGQYFQPHTIGWLDSETLWLLASSFDSSRSEEWGIWRCRTQQSECD